MSRYANGTSVPIDRSKAEIERTLTRYGAEKFAYMSEQDRAQIAFQFKGRAIRMKLDLPRPNDFAKTEKGRPRPPAAQVSECDKAIRQKWRALLLVIKAKLEAIEAGVSTFETEWLPWVVLPNGRTVAEHIGPQIAEGKIPSTLMLTMDEDER